MSVPANPTTADLMGARGIASSAIGGCFLPGMEPWRPDPRTGAVMSFDEWNQWVELGISTGGFGTTEIADIRAGVLNAQRHWGTGCQAGPAGYGTSWAVGSVAHLGPAPAWFDAKPQNPAIYTQAAKDFAAVTTGRDPVTGDAILKTPVGPAPAAWTAAVSAPPGTPIVPTVVPTTPVVSAPASPVSPAGSIQQPAGGGGLSIGALVIGAIVLFLVFK